MEPRTVTLGYEGIWRRKAIYRKNGSSDHTTSVWWFQSSSFHIDLRIPADGNLEKITGFAGTTIHTVDADHGDRLEWRPEISFPCLVPEEIDAGYMQFTRPEGDGDNDLLHETGICGTYEEDWYREQGEHILSCVRIVEDLEGSESQIIQYTIETEHWRAIARGTIHDNFIQNRSNPKKWTEVSVYKRTNTLSDSGDDNNNGKNWILEASTIHHQI
jgi:hypothetical protein